MIGRPGRRTLRLLLCWTLCLMVAFGGGQSASSSSGSSPVSASVQPAQVTVGDSISYQVTVSVAGAGQPSVAVPVISPSTGLSTPSQSGTQTSTQAFVINGQYRKVTTITYVYTVATSKEGEFVIPPSTVTLNGKTYETEPVKVTVQAVPQAKELPKELQGLVVAPMVQGNPELTRKLTGAIFVLPVLSNSNPYNGEQVRISYHLVVDADALVNAGLMPQMSVQNPEVPAMSDFIKDELFGFPQDLKFQERQFGGKVYLVAPIYDAVITSTKSGELTIDPFRIQMVFPQQNGRGRIPSMFADDPFFSMSPLGMGGIQLIAMSPALPVNVKPVPQEGKPADFAGAVGTFKLSAEVDKKTARAYDDTIKLDVALSGEGNAESLSAPNLPALPGFTVVGRPEEDTSGRKIDDKWISTKKFSYTLRPTTPGKYTIPEISISAFDPATEKYTHVATDPIAIEVTPGTHTGPPPTAEPKGDAGQDDNGNESPVEADFRYVSNESPVGRSLIERLFSGAAAIAMFAVPLGLFGVVAITTDMRRRSVNRRMDPRKVASASSSQHLKHAQVALSQGDHQAMAAELASGVRLYFASKFGITGGEATLTEIEERLQAKGAPAELVNGLRKLLETCDSARYAPTTSQADSAAVYAQAEKLLKASESYT